MPSAIPTSANFSVLPITSHCTLSQRRAQGHADADLLGALVDGVGDDAVDAESREEQAEGSERGNQQHEEAAGRVGVVDQGLDGPELGRGLLWIQFRGGRSKRWWPARVAGGRVVRTTSWAELGKF